MRREVSDALYEIAWNERERKAKPEIYQKKYFQALKFAILFQQREFAIFLSKSGKTIQKIILFCHWVRFI